MTLPLTVVCVSGLFADYPFKPPKVCGWIRSGSLGMFHISRPQQQPPSGLCWQHTHVLLLLLHTAVAHVGPPGILKLI